MKRLVVTLGREFGCNAREIGRQLAAKMGVPFYDRELVEQAAARAGISGDLTAKNNGNGSVEDSFLSEFGYGSTASFFTEKAIEAQGYVIRQLANEQSCVMLGRCSDFFLAEFPSVLNAFVYAPLEYRIRHISDCYNLDRKKAEKMIAKIDKSRHRYYKYVTGRNRGDRHGRNIMIDVEKFGIEGTVTLIYQACMALNGN
jgi:CMP/dCMP kinase